MNENKGSFGKLVARFVKGWLLPFVVLALVFEFVLPNLAPTRFRSIRASMRIKREGKPMMTAMSEFLVGAQAFRKDVEEIDRQDAAFWNLEKAKKPGALLSMPGRLVDRTVQSYAEFYRACARFDEKLQAVDLTSCPDEFCKAFVDYRDAVARAAKLIDLETGRFADFERDGAQTPATRAAVLAEFDEKTLRLLAVVKTWIEKNRHKKNLAAFDLSEPKPAPEPAPELDFDFEPEPEPAAI